MKYCTPVFLIKNPDDISSVGFEVGDTGWNKGSDRTKRAVYRETGRVQTERDWSDEKPSKNWQMQYIVRRQSRELNSKDGLLASVQQPLKKKWKKTGLKY